MKKEKKKKKSHSLSKRTTSHIIHAPKYKLFVLLVARGTNTQNNHEKEKAIAKQQNSDTPLSIASLSRGARLFNTARAKPSPAIPVPNEFASPKFPFPPTCPRGTTIVSLNVNADSNFLRSYSCKNDERNKTRSIAMRKDNKS